MRDENKLDEVTTLVQARIRVWLIASVLTVWRAVQPVVLVCETRLVSVPIVPPVALMTGVPVPVTVIAKK
jgi:hypothetical protein